MYNVQSLSACSQLFTNCSHEWSQTEYRVNWVKSRAKEQAGSWNGFSTMDNIQRVNQLIKWISTDNCYVWHLLTTKEACYSVETVVMLSAIYQQGNIVEFWRTHIKKLQQLLSFIKTLKKCQHKRERDRIYDFNCVVRVKRFSKSLTTLKVPTQKGVRQNVWLCVMRVKSFSKSLIGVKHESE